MKRLLLFVLSLLLVSSVNAYLVTSFNDSSSSKDYFFNSSFLTDTVYINLPKAAVLSTATVKSNVTYNWIDNSFTTVAGGIDITAVYNSKIVIDSNSNIKLFYTANYSPALEPTTHVLWLNDLSSTTGIGDIGHPANNQSFDVAIDSNNVLYATWVYYNSTDDKQYLYVANSSNWNNKILVNVSPYNISEASSLDLAYPSLAVDSNNVIHLVWEMYNGSSMQIYYANSSSGWSVMKISNESDNCHTPDILVTSDGTVHVVFQDPPAEDAVETTSMSSGSSVSLAATCVSVGYSNTYIKYTNSSSWPSSTTIVLGTIAPYCSLKFPKISKDSGDNLYLAAWAAYSYQPVFYQALWNESSRQTIGYGYHTQIGIDPEDLIHIVYTNQTGLNITFSNSSSSFAKIFKDDYASSSSIIPDVAIGPNGGLFVTYAKGTSVYYMRYGDLPNTTVIKVNDSAVFSKTNEYKGSDVIDLSSNISSFLSNCNATNGNCSVPLNVSVGSSGRVKLTDLNISYGTKITGVGFGLSFKLSDGTNVLTTAQYSDGVIYAYNGTSLLMKVNTSFRNQPNYSGWTGEAGTTSDNRAYVRVDALPSTAQNLSQKTIYLKWANTSLSKVCVVDSASINASTLQGITNETDCTNAGGTVQTPNTEDLSGVTYFVITGTANSGAVQIQATTNNPPVLSDGSVSPEVGSKYAFYTYTVTVTDPDNDTVTARVYIDGTPYTMEEYDSTDTTTSDGKVFTYSYQFGTSGTHSYYFEATDGTDTTRTITYSGPTVGETLPISTARAPGMSELGAVLVFLMGTAFVLFKARSG